MSKNKPNIIFILNDHQAYYGHGEMAGGPKIQRPNYEKFAGEGAKFTRAYCVSPLCSPARRSMLTGLFPHNHKEIKNETEHPFDREVYLDILAKEGYKNYYYGKWHAGPGNAFKHNCEGFSHHGYGGPYNKPEYREYLKKYGIKRPKIFIEHMFWKPLSLFALYFGVKVGKLYTPKKRWASEHAIGAIQNGKEGH